MLNKIFITIFIAVISLTNVANARGMSLQPDQIVTINSLSGYLKRAKTMQGDFVQVAPNGHRSDGKFYIRRPGLMRFEYAPPTKLLFMADGLWVGVIDLKIKNKADRFPLSETPLSFILSDDPDILKKTDVLDFYFEPGNITITMADKAGKMKGSLTMVFGGDNYDLTSWTITDEHGRQTSIYISNLRINEHISGKQFSLHKY
ncbi:MAG: outer-membrane lipoprotein carrier protein LolA [Rhizobiales bacterium]|nr:outer-membrane lipoprotein carrier protein LolA [Hyphomicrobiales bacterium]